MIILVDCNNFFVSCERIFRPDLIKKPVAVLSKNDGCIIARSQEVKSMGIPMGAPVFKYKDLLYQNNVTLFSANFDLYADISRRIMLLLQEFSPHVDMYSIDEWFLHIPENKKYDFSKKIQDTIYAYTSIPVSVGIGPTKTLAKLAASLAKKTQSNRAYSGDMDIASQHISCVWGIGKKITQKLEKKGIHTIGRFITAPEALIKAWLHIPGVRIYWELKGRQCLELDIHPQKNKSMVSSNSFGTPISNPEFLKASIASHSMSITNKLRRQKQVAKRMIVFLVVHPTSSAPSKTHAMIHFDIPTASECRLSDAGSKAIDSLVETGCVYKKSGIIVWELLPENAVEVPLFDNEYGREEKHKKILSQLDKINTRYGKNTVFLSRLAHSEKPWESKHAQRSKLITTCWQDLLTVH